MEVSTTDVSRSGTLIPTSTNIHAKSAWGGCSGNFPLELRCLHHIRGRTLVDSGVASRSRNMGRACPLVLVASAVHPRSPSLVQWNSLTVTGSGQMIMITRHDAHPQLRDRVTKKTSERTPNVLSLASSPTPTTIQSPENYVGITHYRRDRGI